MNKYLKFAIIVAIIILPLVMTVLLVVYFFGDLKIPLKIINGYTNNLTITPEGFPTLSETIYYLICMYTIIITGLFSYVIWKTSVKSNKLAEKLKNREEHRDEEYVRENALIVYYDLLTGFENVRKLFISLSIKKSNPTPNKLYLSG